MRDLPSDLPPCSRRHGSRWRGTTVLLAVGLMLADSAHAGLWSQSAGEDVDEPVAPIAALPAPVAAPTPVAPMVSLPAVAGWIGGAAGGIAGWVGQTAVAAATTVTDAAGAAGEAVGHRLGVTGEALRQFTWEVQYVFGINGTPVAPVYVAEGGRSATAEPPVAPVAPVADAKPTPAPAPPAETMAAVATAPSAPEAPAAKPAEAKPEPPPPARSAEAPPEAAPAPAAEPVDTRTLAGLALDKSQRRPDGAYFVPKPLQRLFEIRTQKADTRQSPHTVRLPGRIVPDPNAHGDVEASLLGRIEPPRTGFPVLGQTVKQGEILGYVTPAVGVVDRSQVKREVARLTNEIRISAESLEILKQFWFVPFRDGKILQAETKLDGLRRERAALLPMLQTQEVLRAASDGVISVSNAINGRVVHAGEKIFEIVSPRLLWIEAVAADPEVVRDAAAGVSAVAVTPDGQTLDLTYIGSGLALQQQSVPLMFRIDTPIEGLRVGRPVTVTVRNRNKLQKGIPVPREALVADSSGAEQVWELIEPEVFMPHTVKTEVLDGRNVLIVAGVEPGARIVTRGSRLLSQLQ